MLSHIYDVNLWQVNGSGLQPLHGLVGPRRGATGARSSE